MKLFSLFFIFLILPLSATAFLVPENNCETFLIDLSSVLNYSNAQLQDLSAELCHPSNITSIINNTIIINQTINQTYYFNETIYKNTTIQQSIEQPKSVYDSLNLDQIIQAMFLKQLGLNDEEKEPVKSEPIDLSPLLSKLDSLNARIDSLERTPAKEEESSSNFTFFMILGIAILVGAFFYFKDKLPFSQKPQTTPHLDEDLLNMYRQQGGSKHGNQAQSSNFSPPLQRGENSQSSQGDEKIQG